jgi:hypothetical protein
MHVQHSTVASNTRENYRIMGSRFLENFYIEFSLSMKVIALIQICLI